MTRMHCLTAPQEATHTYMYMHVHVHTACTLCMYVHAYMYIQRGERDGWMCVRDRERREEEREGGREGDY